MKTYIPTPEMRTNPLSTQPGGSTVTVKFDGHEIVYTNIKNPEAYIRKITKLNENIESVLVDGEVKWTRPK
jgi:hypothetical protein